MLVKVLGFAKSWSLRVWGWSVSGGRASGSAARGHDALFSRLLRCEQHVLHGLLNQSDHDYDLRPRLHNLILSSNMDHRNFMFILAF